MVGPFWAGLNQRFTGFWHTERWAFPLFFESSAESKAILMQISAALLRLLSSVSSRFSVRATMLSILLTLSGFMMVLAAFQVTENWPRYKAAQASVSAHETQRVLSEIQNSLQPSGPEKTLLLTGVLKLKAMLRLARIIGVDPFMPQVGREMFARTTLKKNPALVEAWMPRFRSVTLDTMSRYLTMLEHRDSVIHRLASISVPTLVVCGVEDKALPPRHSEAIAAGIPGAELHLVQDAGHLSTLEQPDVVTGLMMDFLESNGLAD